VFTARAVLDAHQLATGHELDQPDHPLHHRKDPVMAYTPAPGDRILVRRTPGNHGPVGIMTGIVLDVLTIGGVPGILHFKNDDGSRVYLATNQQMAEIGVTQTIEHAPDALVA
jgi:hypothetical protein